MGGVHSISPRSTGPSSTARIRSSVSTARSSAGPTWSASSPTTTRSSVWSAPSCGALIKPALPESAASSRQLHHTQGHDPHQRQGLRALALGRVIERGASDRQQTALTAQAQRLVRMNMVLRGDLLKRPVATKRLKRDLRLSSPGNLRLLLIAYPSSVGGIHLKHLSDFPGPPQVVGASR